MTIKPHPYNGDKFGCIHCRETFGHPIHAVTVPVITRQEPTKNELLDELELSSRIYGSVLQDTHPGKDEVTKWQTRKEEARSAVDAEIKRLMDELQETKQKLGYAEMQLELRESW